MCLTHIKQILKINKKKNNDKEIFNSKTGMQSNYLNDINYYLGKNWIYIYLTP